MNNHSNGKEHYFDEVEIKILEEGIEAVQDLLCGNTYDSDAVYKLIGLGLWIVQQYEE